MSADQRATAAASDRLNLPINICIAVAFLGLGCVARMVLPWHATKFLCGLAVITVVVCGALAYMRHESRKGTHVEEMEADTPS